MTVYFDTVRRKRPVRDGGELVMLDWKTKQASKAIAPISKPAASNRRPAAR